MMTLLPIHIVGGLVGIITGFVALWATKGAPVHRQAGVVFVGAMLAMSGTGTIMAMMNGNLGNVMGGGLAFYLVTTALLAVRPRVTRFDLAAMLIGLSVALAGFTFGVQAAQRATGTLSGYPSPLFFGFGSIALMSTIGDIRMIRIGGLTGAPRLIRHLWRMCFALFIASGSFFLVTRRVPTALRIPVLLPIPVIVPIVAMIYWRWRIGGNRVFRNIVQKATVQVSGATK